MSLIDAVSASYNIVGDVTTEDKERIAVAYDAERFAGLPIGLAIEDGTDEVQVWLTDAQATVVARSILSALGVPFTEAKGSVDPAALTSDAGWNEATLRAAIREDLTVRFGYAKGVTGSVIENRRLQPSTLSESHGNQIVVGYDPDRDDVRAYRLDRIKGYVAVA